MVATGVGRWTWLDNILPSLSLSLAFPAIVTSEARTKRYKEPTVAFGKTELMEQDEKIIMTF